MLDPDLHDLMPLFVAEARGRLERLTELIPRVAAEGAAVAEMRRELHTLKGAGRMMGLAGLAQLCHVAEEYLAGSVPTDPALLTRVVDTLTRLVNGAESGEQLEAPETLLAELGGGPTAPPFSDNDPDPATGAAQPASGQDIRVPGRLLDRLADGATRQRIQVLAIDRFHRRLADLASHAAATARHQDPTESLFALAASARTLAGELESATTRLRQGTEKQLESLLSLQLQPLRGLFQALARHARELGRRLGKEVEVVLEGEDTTLDRRIARDLEEVLIHLVRNAVDHGIEAPAERIAIGKPAAGTMRLRAESNGNQVRLSLSDDGAGIQTERVVQRALEVGVLDRERAAGASPEEILRLLFTPGFTLASGVSEVSGRGVGLDAVAEAAGRNGGEVGLDSAPGTGTTVTVTVPVARRGERILRVRVGRLRLGLPATVVRRVSPIAPAQLVDREQGVLARQGDRLIPLVPLARVLGEDAEGRLLLEGEVAGHPLAILLDAVEGEEEVLLHLPRAAGRMHPLVEGVAIAADGRPLAVLSPLAVGRCDLASPAATPRSPVQRALRVLLVEDSMVTREMVRRLLEEGGVEVAAAADAEEALGLLGRREFECVVTDVEMPGMDGLALTRHLRSTPNTSHLPVVILTTRDRPDDRLRGLEAGADAYLTKQGLSANELLGVVRRLGGA